MSEDPVDELRHLGDNENVDPKMLAAVLLRYNARSDKRPTFSGMKPTKNFVQRLKKTLKDPSPEEGALQELARTTIENVREGNMPSRKRREILESALRLLLKFKSKHEKSKNKLTMQPLTHTLIAEAYLLRSIFIRPRGFTVPLKKDEAIKKGQIFANQACESDHGTARAWRVKALLALEREKTTPHARKNQEKKKQLRQILAEALEHLSETGRLKSLVNSASTYSDKQDDVAIAIRCCELVSDLEEKVETKDSYLTQVAGLPRDLTGDTLNVSFEQARAYHLLGNVEGTKRAMKDVARLLRSGKGYFFSNPLWNEVVDFIRTLHDINKGDSSKADYWRKIALDVYEACEHRVRRSKKNAYLRLHWSGLRELYDLAFLAESDPERKARIANALKDRPAQRRDVWARESGAYLEEEEDSALDRYVKWQDNAKKGPEPGPEPPVDFQALPKDWTAIHFYLNHLEKKGYALFYDVYNRWRLREFEFDKLFGSFLTWQTNYSCLGMNASKYLVELCKTIGTTMPFLFEKEFVPEGRSIVFVPHDFLRRLPLHGAIKDGKVFLEDHPCSYLPYWADFQSDETVKPNGKYIFKYWNEPHRYQELIEKVIESGGTVFDPASKVDVAVMRPTPEYVIFLCHGQADGVNPFHSKLNLEPALKYRDLRGMRESTFEGSRIFLGACETDLLPSLQSALDEHLTITTAFFDKGAAEIVGTMWELASTKIEQVFKRLYDASFREPKSTTECPTDCSHLPCALWRWQKDGIAIWRRHETTPRGPDIFYDFIPVRLICRNFHGTPCNC